MLPQQNLGSLDSYHTRLRQLAKTCEFTDIDKEIKERIILTCGSSSLIHGLNAVLHMSQTQFN